MVQFICLFMPSLLAVAVLTGLQKRKPDISYILLAYGSFVAAINLSVFFALAYVFHNSGYLLEGASFTNGFAVKYLSIAILLAILLPVVFEMVRRNISMSLSVRPFSERASKKKAKRMEDADAHEE